MRVSLYRDPMQITLTFVRKAMWMFVLCLEIHFTQTMLKEKGEKITGLKHRILLFKSIVTW